MLERVAQRDENAIGVEGLLENVIRPELRRFDRGLNRRVAADCLLYTSPSPRD